MLTITREEAAKLRLLLAGCVDDCACLDASGVAEYRAGVAILDRALAKPERHHWPKTGPKPTGAIGTA